MKTTNKTYQLPAPATRISARLRDTRGFMLAEQLVSIIFIGLLSVVVAAGLGAAMSAYGAITEQARADALLSQAVELVSDELTYAQGAVSADGNSAHYESATAHAKVKLTSNDNGIVLQVLDEDTAKTTETVLVPPRDNMKPTVSVALSADKKTWTITVMVVPQNATGTETLADVKDLTVHRIGS